MLFYEKMNLDIIKKFIFIGVAFVIFFSYGQKKEIQIEHMEVDSYVLPIISLEYRQSIWMNENDLMNAQKDFPNLYKDINSYEDLRNSKLKITNNGDWESYYFPIYAILVLPLKLILQFLGLNQESCFIITHLWVLLFVIYRIISDKKLFNKEKITIVLLLLASPILLYKYLISAEFILFCTVALSVLHLYNKEYKRGAILLSLAALANSTVVSIAIPFIIEFVITEIKKYINYKSFHKLFEQMIEILKLGVCFFPSFIPFISSKISGAGNFNIPSKEMSSYMLENGNGYISRVLSYLFDINLGLCSFAMLIFVIWIIVFIFALKKKNYRICCFVSALMIVVMAYSIHTHINCGMIYCSRYVLWTYPIIAVSLGVYIWQVFSNKISEICLGIGIISTFIVMLINGRYDYKSFNNISKYILDNFPALYSPAATTFHSRTYGLDGAYDMPEYVIYMDSDENTIRKILIKGNKEAKDSLIETINGNILQCVEKIPNDNKFHYININKWDNIQIELNDKFYLHQLGLNGKYTLKEIASSENTELEKWGEGIISLPINISSNSVYKIELNFGDDFYVEKQKCDLAWVDFYGEGYDNPEQEVHNFLYPECKKYSLFIQSGEILNTNQKQNLRIYLPTDKKIDISIIKVYLLQFE